MRLRNKKTGEIKPAEAREDGIYLYDEITEQWYKYELDLLAKFWEYYEEPKEYWYIDDAGVIQIDQVLSSEINMRKSIGNYFETREEAEQAVEKLKAWKRLKDKGFEFCGVSFYDWSGNEDLEIGFSYPDFNDLWHDETRKDLETIFGGEE